MHPILLEKCFPKQRLFVNSNSRYAFLVAPVRTGKTRGAAAAFTRRVMRDYRLFPQHFAPGDELNYWILGPTYDLTVTQKEHLLRFITDDMVDWDRQGGDNRWRNTNRGDGKICLVGGRNIVFKSGESNLIAATVRGIWLTEAARLPEDAWADLTTRISNIDYPGGPTTRWLIADTTPYGRGWFYEQVVLGIISGKFKQAEMYGWSFADSAASGLTVDIAEYWQKKQQMPELFFRRDYDAEWVAPQGQIFSDFDEGKNVLVPHDFPGPDWERYIAADLNSAAEKPACYSVCWHHWDTDRIHVATELAAYVGIDLIEYPEVLVKEARKVPDTVVVVDPSIRNEIKTAIQRGGVTCVDGLAAEDAGVRRLATLVKTRRLTVDPSCGETIRQFFATVWSGNPDKKGLYHIDKKKCDPHYLDGIRYLALWTERNVAPKIKRFQPFGAHGPQVKEA